MKDDSSRPNSIFKMNNKLIWIVKDFEVVAESDARIGNPVPIDPSTFSAGNEPDVAAAVAATAMSASVPTTPSPSGKLTATTNPVAAPAGPLKRPLESPDSEPMDERLVLQLRATYAVLITCSIDCPYLNETCLEC